MTREQGIRFVAIALMAQDRKDWLRHPNSAQDRVRLRYEKKAIAIVEAVETAMEDFAWSVEKG